ncbi:hypothetical protein ACIGFK_17125 [Streptomyces sp. NPDC085524]|uniref:hypothetical protein n=1 Tax=Streptomyces sp. NPDC085524 TaxID=3365728 RepID=UPI0037D38938
MPDRGAEWPPRGVLWLELTSENAANPSFGVSFVVTETARVARDGAPGDDDELVTYTAQGCASVDAQVAVFAPEYFKQYDEEREAFCDRLSGVTRLLDDPVSPRAVVDDIRRASRDGVQVDATAIRHGIAKLNGSRTKNLPESPQIGQWAVGPG